MQKIILSVKNLTVRLKSDNSLILDNVSFDLNCSEVLAIDGFNGSGKSTLLKIIMCQLNDYIIESGEIICFPFSDKNILSFNEKEILDYHRFIGYVPQKDNYEGINKINVEDLIDDAILDTKINKYDVINLFKKYFSSNSRINLKSIPGKLSGGEQRMISIFLGVVCRINVKLIIIDEPLNNLDFENAMKISNMLNEIHRSNRESAFLIVTHCKIITCINRQRKLVNGKLDEEDSIYKCHHCMGVPNENGFYLKKE